MKRLCVLVWKTLHRCYHVSNWIPRFFRESCITPYNSSNFLFRSLKSYVFVFMEFFFSFSPVIFLLLDLFVKNERSLFFCATSTIAATAKFSRINFSVMLNAVSIDEKIVRSTDNCTFARARLDHIENWSKFCIYFEHDFTSGFLWTD